ncbi:phytoene desaturase [Diaminobutyricibacter tongyongensis]|uniref:Phytoene desaturase n=1 Tax=Leifsonia tongyongensis TaxID=1268043 RepID=A0A6L9XXA0_9MICO|nr:phytoene desaturase [Diaminobutyricibacter tongyongensis]
MTPTVPAGRGDRVVVIGAGIAGLATAALLSREGYRVTVVEARDEVGGRAGSWERDGFRFETGPSWYLMPDVFDHFFRLLGTNTREQLDLVRLDPGYRVFFEGEAEPLEITADLVRNLAAFERIEPGASAALSRYLRSARETYRMAVDRFLYSTFASFRPLLTRDVLARAPRLGRLLLEPLDRFIGRYVSDRRLQQVLGYPAVFLGTSPFDAPSMYHLMSFLDLEDGVLYPRGGFVALIDRVRALAEAGGAEIVTGARVTAIASAVLTVGDDRPRVVGVDVTDAIGSRRIPAEVVVSAADLHHTETALLPLEHRTYPQRWWDSRVSGPGAVLVLLGVGGDLPGLAHHSLFFTKDWRGDFRRIFGDPSSVPEPASLYVCRPSATDAGVAPDGAQNLFVLVPVPADPAIGHGGLDGGGSLQVEAIADAAIDQVAAWARIPDLRDRIVLRRTIGPADFERDLNAWKGGALGPAHTLRQSAFLRGRNASARVAGLYYAGGSTTPGIGLPMCLISAELVVKRLRGDTSTGPLAEPL